MALDKRDRRLSVACARLTAIAGALLVAGAAGATATTAVLGISASVDANCTVSATALSFGRYESLQANATVPLNAAGSVSIACTKGTAPRISMDLGQNATAGKRYLALAAAAGSGNPTTLNYEIYQPPSAIPGVACSFPGTAVWGSAPGETFVPAAPSSRTARTYSVCGTIPPGQLAMMGAYADTVIATVNF
ncbi:MAG TPA: spore coat U domain-containing protein [Casimicrobiaceae bacterium]|nr:spore coat U domain-containing protein [Casimicrobiaceae bacterium]